MIDEISLRQAAAALDRVLRAGRFEELKRRIAGEWAAARERRLNLSIGYSITLGVELGNLLKVGHERSRAAVDDATQLSYPAVALNVLLKFAAEIESDPRQPGQL
jgi:hypothetical protein